MDVRQIRCFAEVAKAGSYSKAAERLFVSRQALGKTITKLEDETGLRLLAADEQGVHLTEQGAAFLDDIAPVIASYDALEAKYGLLRKKAVLNLVVSQGALHPFPNDFLTAFIESEPAVEVAIEEIHSDGTLAMVERGEAEIGLLGTHPKYLGGFETLDLAHPGYSVSVPIDSELANKESFELAELDGVPFVTLGERNHLHRFFSEQCAAQGVRPRIIVATSDMNVFEHFRTKESALAFACAPEYTQPYDNVAYIPLHMADDDLFGTYAIRRVGTTLSPAARRFWEFMENYRASHPELR